MATLALTFPGVSAGASARQLAFCVEQATAHLGDGVAAGSIVVTIDNAPSSGAASVQVTGPAGYAGSVFRVG